MDFQKPVTDLIKKRTSVRTYRTDDLPDNILEQIQSVLNHTTQGIFGNTASFNIVSNNSNFQEMKAKIGTYGFISGAKYYIAGTIEPKEYAFEDYGYLFEKIILHLTDMGLGTCWLGGTFKQSDFAKHIHIAENHIIPAVSPFGYAATQNLKEKLIRKAAKANKRKSWRELFFDKDINIPLTEAAADHYAIPLEMLRKAPSASNKQPWLIIKTHNQFDFYLNRTPGYKLLFSQNDLQRIDMGIALAHFELSCKEKNLDGYWKRETPTKLQGGLKYICSWIY